ncbi:hypothetical protein N7463_008795 [Penicillium fimorum]|uniref:Uncharacterized protein n=1 Tax=Penicillium fimorum TaxID=1882269 RepID=A0A9X0C3M1_9EURO|nr:hypothetical protein N7463_008795 [Penicillium fimorum]
MISQKLDKAIGLVRRVEISSLPSVCYNDCSDAGRELQVLGRQPELCDSDSSFMIGIGICQSCIEENGSNDTDKAAVLPLFGDMLDYCKEINSTEKKTANIESLLSQASSLQIQLASLGYSVSSTETTDSSPASVSSTRTIDSLPATTTDSGKQVTVYRTGPAQSTAESSGNDSNISTVVPAVVVPVVVIGIIVVLGFFFVRRRRSRQERPDPISSSLPPVEKAQLHADEFRPELDGTEGTKPQGMRTLGLPPLELPAQNDVRREDVTGELEAK